MRKKKKKKKKKKKLYLHHSTWFRFSPLSMKIGVDFTTKTQKQGVLSAIRKVKGVKIYEIKAVGDDL